MSAGVGGMGLHQPQRRLVCESPCLRARPRIIGHHAPLLRGAEEQVIEPTAQCRPAARRVAAPARVGRAKRQTVDKVTAQERWTNVASPGLVLSVPSMALLGTGYRVQGTGVWSSGCLTWLCCRGAPCSPARHRWQAAATWLLWHLAFPSGTDPQARRNPMRRGRGLSRPSRPPDSPTSSPQLARAEPAACASSLQRSPAASMP